MTLAALIPLIIKYGIQILDLAPEVIAVIAKIEADIKAGKTNTVVTQADLDDLKSLAAQTSAAILAREGITPPPAAAVPF